MKQLFILFGTVLIGIAVALTIALNGARSAKVEMLESCSSQSIYDLMIDMKVKELDLTYQELIDNYICDLTLRLNGNDDLIVEILSIDKEHGIIDIKNVLTYRNFFNQDTSIATRKTIIFNASANAPKVRVDFVVDGVFKEAVFIPMGATYQDAVDLVGFQADWQLDLEDLTTALTENATVFSK